MSGKQGEWCKISVNGGICEGECMEHSPGDEPLEGRKSVWLSLQPKGYKRENFCFFRFKLCFSFTVAHFMA